MTRSGSIIQVSASSLTIQVENAAAAGTPQSIGSPTPIALQNTGSSSGVWSIHIFRCVAPNSWVYQGNAGVFSFTA